MWFGHTERINDRRLLRQNVYKGLAKGLVARGRPGRTYID